MTENHDQSSLGLWILDHVLQFVGAALVAVFGAVKAANAYLSGQFARLERSEKEMDDRINAHELRLTTHDAQISLMSRQLDRIAEDATETRRIVERIAGRLDER